MSERGREASCRENGVAILEFALILPVLLLLSLGGLELSRSLRHTQLAATLSREAASIAYRECTNRDPRYTRSCLERVAEDLRVFGSGLVPQSEISISVYRFDPSDSTNPYRRIGMVHSSGLSSAAYETKLSIPGGTQFGGVDGTLQGSSLSGALRPEVLQAHRTVVVAEAFVPFRALIGQAIIGALFEGGDVFYSVAIV